MWGRGGVAFERQHGKGIADGGREFAFRGPPRGVIEHGQAIKAQETRSARRQKEVRSRTPNEFDAAPALRFRLRGLT